MNILPLLWRNIKWRAHNKFTIIITILQPVLWLVLYSAVAKQTMQQAGIANYTAFMLPGLMVLVCFSSCSSSGIMNYLMKEDGSFYRIGIAPVKRSAIIIAQVLEAILCSFLEVFIMVLLSLCFAPAFAFTFINVLMVIVLVFLTAFFMGCLTYAISLRLPNAVVYETMMNAIVLPIFFLSSALFPASSMHGVLAIVVNLNPFTHVINTLRGWMMEGSVDITDMTVLICFLMVLGCCSFRWTLASLQKESKQ